MNNLSSELRFDINMTEKLMPFITAILVFMGVLMLMFALHFRAWLNDWDKSAESHLTIQVSMNKSEAGNIEEKVDKILTLLSKKDYIEIAREMDRNEIDALLSPWLNKSIAELKLNVPALISVTLKTYNPDQIKELTAEIEKAFPNTPIEHHQKWLENLNSFTKIARKVAYTFASLSFAAIILLVMQITLLTLNTQKSSIHLLSILGANDRYIATKLQKHIFKFAAIGASIGFILALAIIYIIAFKLKNLSFVYFQNFLPSDGQFLVLIFVPLILVLIMTLTARWTVLFQLKKR
ncbi:MAG: hypothetical protein KBE16_03535 [Alphaproteobacteria bacterium]|jgi:cell division transport system permease protein|nr:hypothetical protein [Alphaproteobacteria bacterium]MBP9876993.1 hypothetical protein [Alphaproteobacteria bacterium]